MEKEVACTTDENITETNSKTSDKENTLVENELCTVNEREKEMQNDSDNKLCGEEINNDKNTASYEVDKSSSEKDRVNKDKENNKEDNNEPKYEENDEQSNSNKQENVIINKNQGTTDDAVTIENNNDVEVDDDVDIVKSVVPINEDSGDHIGDILKEIHQKDMDITNKNDITEVQSNNETKGHNDNTTTTMKINEEKENTRKCETICSIKTVEKYINMEDDTELTNDNNIISVKTDVANSTTINSNDNKKHVTTDGTVKSQKRNEIIDNEEILTESTMNKNNKYSGISDGRFDELDNETSINKEKFDTSISCSKVDTVLPGNKGEILTAENDDKSSKSAKHKDKKDLKSTSKSKSTKHCKRDDRRKIRKPRYFQCIL